MRQQTEKGFAIGIILILVVVVGIVGLVGYKFLTAANTQTGQSVQQTQTLAPVGTTASIDNLATQEVTTESSINASRASSDQTEAQTTTGAASNIGGAYDENSL